jgi:hypothetical protein
VQSLEEPLQFVLVYLEVYLQSIKTCWASCVVDFKKSCENGKLFMKKSYWFLCHVKYLRWVLLDFGPCLVPARAPLILVKLALEGFYPTITIKKYCNKMGSLQMGYQ